MVALSAPSMLPGFGPVRYFVGRVPSEWPAPLLPVGGKILGGSSSGIADAFEMKTAVFDFGTTDATSVLRTMATRAGYVLRNPRNKPEGIGGFVESPTPPDAFAYCKEGSFLIGGRVDSVQSPTVYFLTTLEGEGARSNCEPDPTRAGALPSVGVPTLVAPAGVRTVGGGSSSSGTGGMSVSTLMTTLPVDSLLSHFRAQLVTAGWTVTGAPAITEGVAIQRFVFRDRNEPWTGALTVLAAGDKRDVHLLYMRNP
ncbi:MAG: hypothetical protein IT353_07600 [Gemmatimonadaceae bacterium]|nr:hypothetical protein [Gemmatimonadaceae bacterium]